MVFRLNQCPTNTQSYLRHNGIAKSSNNGLLEEMLYRLNIAHFSRHILQVLNLDATELKKHFQVLVKAVLEGNREKALQAHSSWIKTILTQHNL